MSKALLYDSTVCIGCKQCEQACASQNKLPYDDAIASEEIQSAHKMTVVLTRGDKFMRRLCMNCEEPSCASVCPVGALQKTALGPVTYDASKCMGCRYCMVACPFSVPKYEWGKLLPKVQKCTMCPDRVAAGKADGVRGDLSDRRDQVRRARRTDRRSAASGFATIRASTSTTSTASRKWAAHRFCCSPPFRSRPSAIAAILPKIRCPCSPTACSRTFPTSFRWVEWCWEASGGSRIGAKKSPSPRAAKRRAPNQRMLATTRTGGSHNGPRHEFQVHLLEARLLFPDGRRPLRNRSFASRRDSAPRPTSAINSPGASGSASTCSAA